MQPAEYARLAEVEDRLWYLRALRERIVQELARVDPPKGAKVLDAGCGTGALLKRLWEWRADLALQGLDCSPIACGHVRASGHAVSEGSIEELPFADGLFDVIVAADVLPQVHVPLLALVECHRCLRPGGTLVLNAAAMPWLWSYHDEVVQSVQRFRGSALRALVREAGFSVDFATHWNFLLLPLVVLRRKVLPIKDGGSDVRPLWAPLNALLGWIATLERKCARIRLPLPIGSSYFVVASKPVRAPRGQLR